MRPRGLPAQSRHRLTGWLGLEAAGAAVDAPLLARLRLASAYADEATAQEQAVGLLVKAPHTMPPIQLPWVATMNRHSETARKLAAELAMPPAQRSRAGMAPRDAVPPDDERIL